ncbi:MAG: glycoside hydrolase family 15 protein [Chloroflexota bacterium]
MSLADYAIVGNSRTSALISRSGSVDWLCLPRPDSPSIFGAILDPTAGRLTVRPAGAFTSSRRYVPGTNVLETTFRAPDGAVMLRDVMPVTSEEAKRRLLWPQHELLRQITGLDGRVRLEVTYEPRASYGRTRAKLVDRGALGIWAEDGRFMALLRGDCPLAVDADGAGARGQMEVAAGETCYLSFSYGDDAPAVTPALGESANQRMEQSIAWWQEWSARCTYRGKHVEAVLRSLLVLKLLTYAPSGAVLAAPTTSLPEDPGGVRNWDYRYCWLRDASLTIRALLSLGYQDEATAFSSWLLHTTRLTQPDLQIVYDVFGGTELTETELPHLAGYAGSRPVRIGNGAHAQFQLDVYGEVLDAVSGYLLTAGGRLDRDTKRMLRGLGNTVCRRWTEPDEGIWEVRSGRAHHTYSKVMCWVALDRLIKLHEAGLIEAPVNRYRAVRDAIKGEIETRGFDAGAGSYVRSFDGQELDTSLLLLPIYGYCDGSSERMASTIDRTLEGLGIGPFVYRYLGEDGLPGGEGAFGIACFWAVEALARAGQVDRARGMFDELIAAGNDVGLYGEEFDPHTGEPLGNFPQAFTHVGLINAALTLERSEHVVAT